MTVKNYLNNKKTLRDTPCTIRGGKMYAMVGGDLIPYSQFKKRYPLPARLWQGLNPNTKTDSLR